MEERKRLEAEHSDRRRSIVKSFEYYTDSPPDRCVTGTIEDADRYDAYFSNMKFYSITRSSFEYRDRILFRNIKGARALDYCCGNGEIAVEMAVRGAGHVTGIDISPVAVENARELAGKRGVSDRCDFFVMDAENTTFPEGTFDLIHEYGALHHLELSAAFKELNRILKSDGELICTEAMRHNPLIHRYRKRTPHLRTQWEVEHILGVPEILRGRSCFAQIDFRMFHLAVLAVVPFRKTGFFKPMLSLLEAADRVLLAIPYLNRLAWISVIRFSLPVKA